MTYVATYDNGYYVITCENTGRIVCDSPYRDAYDETIADLEREGHMVIEK